MKLKGQNFIGNELSAEGKEIFNGVNPATGKNLQTDFHEATLNEINKAINKAEQAFAIYNKKSGKEKALFLETITEEILALGDDLLKRCNQETGLIFNSCKIQNEIFRGHRSHPKVLGTTFFSLTSIIAHESWEGWQPPPPGRSCHIHRHIPF